MHYNRKLLIAAVIVLGILVGGGYYFLKPNVGARTGGRGATTLGGLNDVSTAGAIASDVLTFNGATWDPQAGGGGGGSIGAFHKLVSSTPQDASGARFATGTMRVVATPSGGESSTDFFVIDNGATSTRFEMFNNAGGGNSFTPGLVQIDVGGGVSRAGFFTRAQAAISQAFSLNVQAQCDTYYDSFDSGAFSQGRTCGLSIENGTMATDTIFLTSPVVGTGGNITITDSSTLLDFVGMSGGTN